MLLTWVSEGVLTGLDGQDLVLILVLVARATTWGMCHVYEKVLTKLKVQMRACVHVCLHVCASNQPETVFAFASVPSQRDNGAAEPHRASETQPSSQPSGSELWQCDQAPVQQLDLQQDPVPPDQAD